MPHPTITLIILSQTHPTQNTSGQLVRYHARTEQTRVGIYEGSDAPSITPASPHLLLSPNPTPSYTQLPVHCYYNRESPISNVKLPPVETRSMGSYSVQRRTGRLHSFNKHCQSYAESSGGQVGLQFTPYRKVGYVTTTKEFIRLLRTRIHHKLTSVPAVYCGLNTITLQSFRPPINQPSEHFSAHTAHNTL